MHDTIFLKIIFIISLFRSISTLDLLDQEFYSTKPYIHAHTNQVLEAKRLDEQASLFDPHIFSIIRDNKINEVKPILELGCGTCSHTKTIRSIFKQAEIIGIDIDEKQLSLCRKDLSNHRLVHSSIVSLPFRDNSASAAILIHVLEHLKNSKAIAALAEARRVLSKDGIIIGFEVMMSSLSMQGLPQTKKFVDFMIKEQAKYGNANYGEFENSLANALIAGFTKDQVEYQEKMIKFNDCGRYVIDLLETAKDLIPVDFEEVRYELLDCNRELSLTFGVVWIRNFH